jgi:hypothetical protein
VNNDAVKAEFACRLRALVDASGLTQVQIVKLVQEQMPEHGRFERGNLTAYLAGHSFPRPIVFHAMCRAFKVAPEELMPPTKGPGT